MVIEMDGQMELLDLLEPEPTVITGDPGTFAMPGDLEAMAQAKDAHFEKFNVHRGNWRPYRGWTPSSGTGQGSEHLAAAFNADLRCHASHKDARRPCHCVGGYYYRVYCFGCNHWTGIYDRENGAWEEHLDHCWPGWRDLPVIEATPNESGGYKYAMPDNYPPDWMVPGAPTRDCRGLSKVATRHVPAGNQFGGVKTAVIQECKQHGSDT
ncbi:DUF6349 family protein [Glutamicibacter sp. X7]